jgi:hypothetical protein
MSTRTIPGTAPIVGTLRVNSRSVGYRPCIPTAELRPGDTLYAAGYTHGGDRRCVYDVYRDATGTYVHTRDGWYRWQRVYCHVAAFWPPSPPP